MFKSFINERFPKKWQKYFYLIILFRKYIIFFILIISFVRNFRETHIGIFQDKIEEEDDYIIKNEKYFLKLDIVEKFNSFLKLCKKGELIDNTKYPLLKNPKISIIIPIYNGGKYLNYSLRTIQNQNLKEVEIIIIDDCSTDDSLNYVERLMKEDPRIRLIKNFKNRKILYSKSIAALNSNGEFILELDQDDMFIREDLFSIIYKESKKYNLDLVQFRDFVKEELFFNRKTRINFGKLHWILPKKTFYMEKPELKKTLFKNNNNYLLWGLLINSKIYKKAIYNIWELIINYQLIYNEDYISTTMILIFSQNYKFLNMFGILHLKHEKATSFNCFSKGEFHLSNIFFPSYINNYHVKDNPEDVQIIYNYINLNKLYQTKASSLYPKFNEFNLRNLFYNNYLLPEEKKEIFNIFNIQRNQSKLLSTYSYLMNNKEFTLISQFQNMIINISNKNENYIFHKLNKTKLTKLHKIYFQYIYININNSCSIFNVNKIIKLKLKKNKKQSTKGIYPKVSIIIYSNEIKFLEETLISIIEQKNFFSFEIIIVYDNVDKMCFSTNFKYKNIIIINNLKRKGIMYSFLIGTLASKGQYILNFLSGYTLTKKNVLIKLYNYANDKNIDILEFNLLINKDEYINKSSLNLYKCLHYNSSLNTNIIKYNKNYKEIDQDKELLINKLFKAEIYKDIIYKYELIKYDKIIYNYFDDILIYLIKKEKYIFQNINVFGVLQNIKNINTLKLNQNINSVEQKISDTIFYINFLFENSANEYKEKKYVYDEYVNRLNLINNKIVPKSNESIKLFKKFMKCKYINKLEKLELAFFYDSLNN